MVPDIPYLLAFLLHGLLQHLRDARAWELGDVAVVGVVAAHHRDRGGAPVELQVPEIRETSFTRTIILRSLNHWYENKIKQFKNTGTWILSPIRASHTLEQDNMH